jgi:predicted Ser/Thr protein kinase/WD40 repeat protein
MTAIAPSDRYRRLDLLGRGGMGEVFLADDLVLKRKVAIKVVHRSALSNPRAEKLLRREAKAAAALDNPFICKVYEVGEDAGGVFIAMEYVQGETLRQRMTRGPIPLRDVVSLAREIADGLDEADRKRVIHRDLKPSNIIITAQGHVKIMDFGLAKRLPGEDSIQESSGGTPDGMVVGTREYMSPEQLRGKPLEPSSDLFALGLILFEMVAGHPPFKKSSAIDTQFAILNEAAPDLCEACPGAPEELCDLVERLLTKAAADRPRMGEVRERLAGLSESARGEGRERTLATSASVEAFVASKPRVVLALGLVLVLALVALSLWIGLRPEPAMPPARMATLVTWPSNEGQAALSPDARSVTFISNRDGVRDIWLMDLSGGEPRRITQAPGNLTAQTFSEDGTEVAYMLESETEKLLQTIRIDGGPPTRSLALPNTTRIRRMIRWVGSDLYVETEALDLAKVSLVSGHMSPVETLPREAAPFGYDVSRDGRVVAFGARNRDGTTSIWERASGQEARPITRPGFQDGSPFFSDPAGRLRIFFESTRSGQEDLWLMERPSREPRQITFGSNREFIESVSRDGDIIVFSEVLEGASLFSFDPRTGLRSQLTAENTRDITPSIAKDGTLAYARVSLASNYPWTQSAIHVAALRENRLADSRLLLREGWNPLISPSGKWLAYLRYRGAPAVPYLHLLDIESGHSREIGEVPNSSRLFMDFPWYFSQRDILWSGDDDLYFVQGPREQGSRLMKFTPGSGQSPTSLFQLRAGDIASGLVLSSDGSSLFYVRTQAGQPGGAIQEVARGVLTERMQANEGSLALVGVAGPTVIFSRQARPSEDRVEIGSVERNRTATLFTLDARPGSLRFLPALNSLAFSRRDTRAVENAFLRRLDTGVETMITANGIPGIGYSPISTTGSGLLVFSQQLRNRDLGIIHLDRP